MIKAGTAIVDISPEKGVQLAGYPHCPRHNEGIHDPLYAVALYLNDSQNEVVFVTLDLLNISKSIVNEVRRRAGKQNIMFTVTHTHSAPWGANPSSGTSDTIKSSPEYLCYITEKITEVVNQAVSNTFAASVGTYIGKVGKESGVGGNRRDKDGLSDDSVNVLGVKDDSGKLRAVLVNYTLHPTFLHADNLLVSADFPCYIRRYFAFAAPDANIMYAQGTAGNQSSRYFRTGQNFEEAARVGTTIAVEAHKCLEKAEYKNDIKIGVKQLVIDDMRLKKFPSEEEALAGKLAAEAAFEEIKKKGDYIEARNAEVKMFGAQSIYRYTKLSKEGFVSPELPYEVMFASLGDTLIVSLQGEIFVEYGLALKEASKYKKTFVFSVSNGYAPGYIYTPQAGEEGGYEVGNSMFAPDAGEYLLERIKKEL